jgi:YidC/Oxa1 family membrane protein insertase
MDERRLLIFIALSFIIIAIYLPRARRRPAEPTPEATEQTRAQTPVGETEAEAAPTREPEPPPVEVELRKDTRERRVEIDLPYATVAFTNRGARPVGWRLTDYQDERERPEEMVLVSPNAPRALDIETADERVNATIRRALFLPSRQELKLRGDEDGILEFEYAENDLRVTKSFRFRASSPLVEVRASVERRGREMDKRILWGPGVGLPSGEKRDANKIVALEERSVERLEVKKLTDHERTLDAVRWVGVENRYFAALLLAPDGRTRSAVARAVEVAQAGEEKQPVPLAAMRMDPDDEVLLYVGAKDYFALSPLGHHLKDVVPVGEWIGPIVVPFMALLRWVHSHVGNYGWSIVLLTVLINLAMAPFRHFGIVNGIKMARMAPELRVIQERYRKLPMMERQQKMQPEMNALYAKHGMSMGGQMLVGCLPMLLTFPFLIAFYRVLDVAVELKGASFLWIPDLSLKDPIFLTPILMSASMFLMQKMMPSAADPTQQRMMMLMPIVLGVMFFAAPAGLNLYWLSSNVCAIGQQGVTMSIVRGRTPQAKLPSKKKERRR